MITRFIEQQINKHLFKGKAILIFGARQVGKTTLVNNIIKDKGNSMILNGDEADIRELLYNTTSGRIKSFIGNNKIVVIDEAQRIPDIGITLKLITDQLKNVQLIATGSSAFELASKINEPLTGRKYEFSLFPFSFEEMVSNSNLIEEIRYIKHRLVFGYYPEIATKIGEEIKLLKMLASSYLYKDLLSMEQVKKPVLLEKILKALALQIGNEVSYYELGEIVGADKETVEKYIDLLEKTYIIFKLNAFSRNIRNEIKKGKKIYFYDNGIRNAVIGNYNIIENRSDIGALWENFIISERIKYLHNHDIDVNSYFWRTTQQQEIDYIEEKENRLSAYEIKWNPRKSKKIPKSFSNAYPKSEFEIINKNNFYKFITHIR